MIPLTYKVIRLNHSLLGQDKNVVVLYTPRRLLTQPEECDWSLLYSVLAMEDSYYRSIVNVGALQNFHSLQATIDLATGISIGI